MSWHCVLVFFSFNLLKCSFFLYFVLPDWWIKLCVSETIRKAPFPEAKIALTKQKNTFCGTTVCVPLPKFCEKLFPAQSSLKSGNHVLSYDKNDFWNGGCPPSWILKILIFGHLAVIEFQMCCCVPNFIKVVWFFVEIWLFYGFWRMSAILNFQNLQFTCMSCDLYRHAIVLPCAKLHWNRTIYCWFVAEKRFFKWRPPTILNCKNFHIWSSGCHRVPNLQLCTIFHQSRIRRFRWDMATRWRTAAILNFMGPKIGSLKSSCRTFYRSSTDTIALNSFAFEKIAFLVRILAIDRQTDKRMDRTTA